MVPPESGSPWRTLPHHSWLGELAPSLYVQAFPRRVTDDDLASFLAAIEPFVLGMHAPYAWIVNVAGLLSATAKQRKAYAAFMDRVRSHDAQFCAAAGIVASNAFTRGLVTAVFWLSTPPYPYRVCASIEDAGAFASEKLAERSKSHQPPAR